MGLVTDDLTAQMPVKEELDRAVPPHELLDVSASKAKAELATRGGLAGRQLPTSKKGSGGLSSSSSVSPAYSITYKEGIFILMTEHYKLHAHMSTVTLQ
jgi:neurabin